MFRTNQIITATNLAKHLPQIFRWLRGEPQSLLITQKNGDKFVLVNAEIYEDLLDFKIQSEYSKQHLAEPPPSEPI